MQDNLGRFIKGTHWRSKKPHWDRDWLVLHYVTLKKSSVEVARECGCTDNNIVFWLSRHGIPRRTMSEVRAIKKWGQSGIDNPMFGKFGEANPRYVDGSSPERQRLYAQGIGRAFVKSALSRDNYRCRRCDASKTTPNSLHVHHIRSWAGNEDGRFSLENVVTLCRKCHSWVHSRANISGEYLL